MDDCPNCEYHKNRAARWRAEAYAQAGHDIIERPWVGLTDEDLGFLFPHGKSAWLQETVKIIEAKLKEKNT